MKEYKHNRETFTIDDSADSYIKVTYAAHPDLVGYIGLNLLNSSREHPYRWMHGLDGSNLIAPHVASQGLTRGNPAKDLPTALRLVCDNLIRRQREREWGPEEVEGARQALHKFAEGLPGVER